MKDLRIIYQSRDGATGLTDVRAAVFLNGALKNASMALTELGQANAPGIYELVIPAATLTSWGVTRDQANFVEGVIDSPSVSAPAPFRAEVQAIDLEQILDAETATKTAVAGVQSAVDYVAGKVDGLSPAVQAVYDAVAQNKQALDYIAGKSGDTITRLDYLAGKDDEILQAIAGGSNSEAAILSAIQSLQNNTTFEAQLLAQLVKPKTGTITVNVPITVQNEKGSVEDPDNNEIRVSLFSATGEDLSSRLVGATSVAGTPGSPGSPGSSGGSGSGPNDIVLAHLDGNFTNEVSGGASISVYSPGGPPAYQPGKFGQALVLTDNGSGSANLRFAVPEYQTSDAFSLSFQMQALGVEGDLVTMPGFQLQAVPGGNVGLLRVTRGSDVQDVQLDTPLTGRFAHFNIVRFSNIDFVFVDGNPLFQSSARGTVGGDLVFFGGHPGGSHGMNAFLDEVRFQAGNIDPATVGTPPSAPYTVTTGGGGASTPATPATPATNGYVTAIKDKSGKYHVGLKVSDADAETPVTMEFAYDENGQHFEKSRVSEIVGNAEAAGTALESTLQDVKQHVYSGEQAAQQSAAAAVDAATKINDGTNGLAAIRAAIANLAASSGVDFTPVTNAISDVRGDIRSVKAELEDSTIGLEAIKNAAEASRVAAVAAAASGADLQSKVGAPVSGTLAGDLSALAAKVDADSQSVLDKLASLPLFGGRAF